jgi:hypothetical protein
MFTASPFYWQMEKAYAAKQEKSSRWQSTHATDMMQRKSYERSSHAEFAAEV